MGKQIHTGSGDNVGNNKIVNIISNIEPKYIKGFIADLMQDISHRKISDAERKLESIANIDGVDINVKSLLNALKTKVALIQEEKGLQKQKQELQNLVRNKELDYDTLDVAFSILLHFESKIHVDTARDRYFSAEVSGPYTNEVFLSSYQLPMR
jgi:hypothetical protein